VSPTVLTRAEQQEQTRERLLEAAALVFERNGFHGTKLEDVAREAGVTTGAVYSNFDGKEDLFLALADRQISRRIEGVREVAEQARQPGGVEAAITNQFEIFFDETASFPLLFHEFWSYGARNPGLRDEFAARREAVVDAMAEAIAAAAEASDRKLAVPARTVAVAVRAAMNGLAFDRAIDGGKLPMETVGWAMGALLRAATEEDTKEGKR